MEAIKPKINWNFIPKSNRSRGWNDAYQMTVYYNPNSKGQTYSIQIHPSTDDALRNSDVVNFGKFNGDIVVTNKDMGNPHKVNTYSDSNGVQVNGKDLCLSIIDHFKLNKDKNQKIRLELTPINTELWKVNIHSVESK